MREALKDLRFEMEKNGVDACLIPSDDFHGSEYTGAYFQCRAYISGFTGSAGTLVVTKDFAGLWTDGRYFLQAAEQLNGSGFTLMKMGEPGVPEIPQWLLTHLTSGQTLCFDGRTVTTATGRRLIRRLHAIGVQCRTDLDLPGSVWKNRPALSSAPAWELPLRYAGVSRKDKLIWLRGEMEKSSADAMLLTSLENIGWLLNLRGGDIECVPVVLAFLLVEKTRAVLFADENKFPPELAAALAAEGITIRPYLSVFTDIRSLSARRILLDPEEVNLRLRQSIPENTEVRERTDPVFLRKAIKNETEQKNFAKAHRSDGLALIHFWYWLKTNLGKQRITELSAAAKLEEFRAKDPEYLGPSFEPILAYGAHGAIVHYSPTPESDAEIKPEGFLLADTGGHYYTGSTDVTRTFAVGPLTAGMRHHYTLVLQGHLRLADARFREGTTGPALDYTAREPLAREGLDFNHGTGHGVGYLLSVHEGPQVIRRTAAASVPFQAGMITSDEPGLYLTGAYGIRIENLLLTVEKERSGFGTFLGFETLTLCPYELEAVDPEMLTVRDRALLNAYHRRVAAAYLPYLTGEEAAWLRHATREI